MSSSEVLRSAMTIDSNIPVPKKPLPAARKSKGCAQLPELQRYIETIIKASSECESEDAAPSEHGRGFPREKKLGRYSVYKGRERGKRELHAGGRKSKNIAKAPLTEAVSTGGEVAIMSVSDIDDPRNWRTDGTRNGGADPEIGNFLEKLFPNPYTLGNVEYARPDRTPEKREENDSGDTVPISNVQSVRTQTEVQSESTDNAFLTFDSEIKPRSREKIAHCTTGTAAPHESNSRPVSRRGGERGSTSPKGSDSTRALTLTTTPVGNKSSHSIMNNGSRASSIDSIRSRNQKIDLKAIKSKAKSDLAFDKENDSDIGKLKLLKSDSEDSVKEGKNSEENDLLKQTVSRTFDDLSEFEDLNDLRQIFDIMSKAADNFFELTAKNEQTSFDVLKSNEMEKILGETNEISQKNKEDSKQPHQEQCEQKDNNVKKENTSDEIQEKTKQTVTERNFRNLNDKNEKNNLSPETGSDLSESLKVNDEDSTEADSENTGEKIDEVLQYMYDCIKKFKTVQEEKPSESNILEEKKDEKLTEELEDKAKSNQTGKDGSDHRFMAKDSHENLFAKSDSHAKEFLSEGFISLDDSKKPSISKIRSRKRQDKNSSIPESELPPHNRASSSVRSQEAHSTVGRNVEVHFTAESPRIRSDNSVHTAEIQNELGSYSEQVTSQSHVSKSYLPQSIRFKKSKMDNDKTIKDVLETEERLLANYLNPKSGKKVPDKSADTKARKVGNHAVVKSGRNATSYPFITDFKRSNSNFVICVSSLPRNLRTMSANRTSFTLSPTLSLSLNDINKNWNVQQLPYYTKMSLKKIPVISDIEHFTHQFTYNVSQGSLMTVEKSIVAYIANTICLKQIVRSSKSEEELLLKSSECLVNIQLKPIKKSILVESSTSTDLCLMTQGEESINDQEVNPLIEALEKTEGKLMVLEQSDFINSETMSCCSEQETYKCDTSEIDWEGDISQEKIHNLLLRTYSLQYKLHRYLHKMTCVHPIPVCPFMQHETCQQHSVMFQNQEQTVSQVFKPQERLKTVNQAITTEIQTVDHATSYCPPEQEHEEEKEEKNENVKTKKKEQERKKEKKEERKKEKEEDVKVKEKEQKEEEEEQEQEEEEEEEEKEEKSRAEEKKENEEENQNDEDNDDDNSSVCSFKSSNDCSEVAETKPFQRGEFLQKIFNEIESFKQGIITTKKEKILSEECINENTAHLKDNKIVEYDPKMPAKMLRTVFKGQKSTTELTVGLKDVPMTHVSNISVEKRKFSPNHTKISICILKEPETPTNIQKSIFKTNSTTMRNKFSTLYLDQIGPSLSKCRTEYSRLEDNNSKASESINETSDEDDDDFKSVASSPSNVDVGNRQETRDDNKKLTPPPPQKTFTKYRFDFYRKMDMSLDAGQAMPKPVSSTVCRYKELEPLKEALTEMQIRMRSIKQDTFYTSNDYYERALKLAKMSAGYCQSCGNRSVIPKDTFGYYKSLLPRRYSSHRHGRHFRMAASNPSYYSFRSSNGESFCDLDIKHSSSYLLNRSNAPFIRSSLHDMPILIGRI